MSLGKLCAASSKCRYFLVWPNMINENGYQEVVVILPYVGDKVLMQLRDLKPSIAFPGNWGFFGGSIEVGEKPIQSADRELYEEIGFKAEKLYEIGTAELPRELGKFINHSFFCALTTSMENLILREGLDLGLFSLEDVKTKLLYSPKMNKDFPVVPSGYVAGTIEKMWSILGKRG